MLRRNSTSSSRLPIGYRKLFLRRGTAGGFGFSLATHPTALDNGYIHYISEVDPGSSAGTEGLRLGDRVAMVDATQCNSLPHKFVAALFAQAGRGDRPVCMVVSDATGTISDALARTKQVSVAPADAVVPSAPRYPGQCHMVIKDPNGVDDFDDLVMELVRVRFGGKYPWVHCAGWLYHDERNPLAKQPLGPAAKDKIVLVLCGMIPLSSQIKNCENAGAKAVIFVNTVATAPIDNLELGPHEREDCVIPGLNISMRDGVVLLKMCKQAAVPATVFGGPEILLRRGGGDDTDDGYLRYQPNEDDDSDEDEDEDDYDEEDDDPVDMNPGMVVRFGDDDADEMTIRCGHADFGNYLPDDGMTLEIFYPDGNETADRPFASMPVRKRGELRDKAVIVFRGGTSTIYQKVMRCQEAGAQACLVAEAERGGEAFRVVYSKTGEADGIKIPVLTLGNADALRICEAFLGGKFVEADLYHDMLEDGHGNSDGNEPLTVVQRRNSLKISKKVRAATRSSMDGYGSGDGHANLDSKAHMHMPSAGGAASTISLDDWKNLGPDKQPELYFPVKDLDIMQQLFPNGMPAGLEAGGPAPPAPEATHTPVNVAMGESRDAAARISEPDPDPDPEPVPEPVPEPEPEPARAAAVATAVATAVPQNGVTGSGQAYIKAPVGVFPVPGWLHGITERSVVDALLKSGGDATATHGRFLVREIEPAPPFLAAYCLSVMYKGKPTHHPIGMSEKVPGSLAVGRYLSVYPDPTGSESLVKLIETLSHPMVGTKEGATFYPHWPVQLTEGVQADGKLVVTVAGGGASESSADARVPEPTPPLLPQAGSAGGLKALTHDWTHHTEAMASKENVKAWAIEKLDLGGGLTPDDNGKFIVLSFQGKHVLALVHKAKLTLHALVLSADGTESTINRKHWGAFSTIQEMVALLSASELPSSGSFTWPTRFVAGLNTDGEMVTLNEEEDGPNQLEI